MPNVVDQIALTLQNIDRQALLILKTNDLLRSIEYALKTNEMMSGLKVMIKCCLVTGYDLRLKNAKTLIQKISISVDKVWSMVKFFLFYTFLSIRATFS